MDGMPLRVLFLSPYFRPYLGGIERAIERLSLQLLQSPEVEAVGVLTTKYSFPPTPHPEWADRERTPDGVSIFRLAGFPRKSFPIYSVPLVWFSPGQIRRYLEEFNPHVIHFVGDGWFWGHFWAWMWRKGRSRFVFTPSYHALPPSRAWLKPVNRLLCRGVDTVAALTRQEAVQMTRDYGVRDEKLAIIGWGASAIGGASIGVGGEGARRAREDARDTVTILCVGRLSRHKGQAWLLEVYRQARESFQKPARLVLVGRDEDAEPELRERVKAEGLEDVVIFTGELDDTGLGEWYRDSDLLALFSQYEAFGLVYFEAMLCGLPVLTHEVGANRELLTRGAAVVPRFDKEAAVAEMTRMVNEPDYRRRLGEDGLQYASREFTWQAVADKYLALYRG